MKKNILLFLVLIFCVCSVHAKTDPNHIASYWEKVKGSIVQCLLCPRKCILDDGKRGVCTVRINKKGTLYTLGYGNPVAVHIDPIEKKPFFHVDPGAPAFSLAVAGCNMRCSFCQNWQISQVKPDETDHYDFSPNQIIKETIKAKSDYVVYTYTEPTVFYEYMLDICKLAEKNGLKNAMHSCGYINPEPLKELLKYMFAVNIDLKSFREEFYQKIAFFGTLEPVLEALKITKEAGVWLEITTLIIPTANDDPKELREMSQWIKDNLGPDVPLHFSRFHPTYKLTNLPPTPIETLEKAYDIAKDVGLNYVYIGNVPGHPAEDTVCPQCGNVVVDREGYRIKSIHIKKEKCTYCGYKIPGRWER